MEIKGLIKAGFEHIYYEEDKENIYLKSVYDANNKHQVLAIVIDRKNKVLIALHHKSDEVLYEEVAPTEIMRSIILESLPDAEFYYDTEYSQRKRDQYIRLEISEIYILHDLEQKMGFVLVDRVGDTIITYKPTGNKDFYLTFSLKRKQAGIAYRYVDVNTQSYAGQYLEMDLFQKDQLIEVLREEDLEFIENEAWEDVWTYRRLII